MQDLKMNMIQKVSIIFIFANIYIYEDGCGKNIYILKHYIFFVEIELANIEAGDQAINDDKANINIDCQSDTNQQNVDYSTETVSDNDNQIEISSMENQNEIFSTEDDSPLVEDIISQSKIPNEVFLCQKK